jgi:NTE family protein
MKSDPAVSPDVLVLGGGGTLGEAWMNALLTALDEPDGFDVCGCSSYVGTSAGSIVATALATGVRPSERLDRPLEQPIVAVSERHEEPSDIRRALEMATGLGTVAAAPLASWILSSTAATAGGAALRRAALARVRPGRRALTELDVAIVRSGARWDGRLRIAVVDMESGRRVMIGVPGAPELSVSEAVQASCAIPGVFRPVHVGGHTYVDGGAWSPTNMDAAEVARNDRVLCLNPTGSLRPTLSQPLGALGLLSRSRAAAEALVLTARGARVSTINPDEDSARAMGTDLMDPTHRDEVIIAGLAQGRRLARGRTLTRER